MLRYYGSIAILLMVSSCFSDSPRYVGLEPDAMLIDAAIGVDAAPDAMLPDAPPAELVLVPAGQFLRGCNAAVEDCTGVLQADELPSGQVTLSAFRIDKTEVTQDAYQQCMAAGECSPPAGNFDPSLYGVYPVVRVTWAQALDYCNWKGGRLPTEAEWEKAARGTDGRAYPWGNSAPTCTFAYYADCPGGTTTAAPVGSRPAGASPYGVLDMAGNVSEWVADWYNGSYYATGPTTDPSGPDTGTNKTIRGGSWNAEITNLRSADRFAIPPTGDSAPNHGFRCAYDAT